MGESQNNLVEKRIIKTKEGELPKELYPANLNSVFIDKFVTWDEVHSKVIPEYDDGYLRTPYKYHIMKFPCDYNGKLYV